MPRTNRNQRNQDPEPLPHDPRVAFRANRAAPSHQTRPENHVDRKRSAQAVRGGFRLAFLAISRVRMKIPALIRAKAKLTFFAAADKRCAAISALSKNRHGLLRVVALDSTNTMARPQVFGNARCLAGCGIVRISTAETA